MRAVHISDIVMAARALVAVPGADRVDLCEQMVQDAERADRYVRRLRKLHPEWGNGTLHDSARRHPLGVFGPLDDPEIAACLQIVLARLQRRPRTHGM